LERLKGVVILDILMEKFIFMSNRVIEKHRYLRNQHSLYLGGNYA